MGTDIAFGAVSEALTAQQRALLATARDVLETYRGRTDHDDGTACALRTRDGAVFTGVYVATTIGTASVHAEAAAVADAVEAGSLPIETIVGISHPGTDHPAADAAVIPPCGTCRELIAEYGPDAVVIVEGEHGPQTMPIEELLPETPWFDEWAGCDADPGR